MEKVIEQIIRMLNNDFIYISMKFVIIILPLSVLCLPAAMFWQAGASAVIFHRRDTEIAERVAIK
ncbi:MAG: hypothetical protein C0417_12980 [Chlorobiaceae bacterium]|nr:hypothetical protein [Chlorobiaceae bacterium]